MKGENKMKKILFTIAILVAMILGANAQGRDAFFSTWDEDDRDINPMVFALPNHFNEYNNDANSPLGSGLLILTALGAGYAVSTRRKKNK